MKGNLKSLIFVFMLLASVSAGSADEKVWTNQERLQNREAVIKGKVVSLKKFVDLGENENMWIATVAIENVVKPHSLIQGNTVDIYFLSGKEDSPHHIKLKEGEEAEFYLDVRPMMNKQKVLFLDVPADVKSKQS